MVLFFIAFPLFSLLLIVTILLQAVLRTVFLDHQDISVFLSFFFHAESSRGNPVTVGWSLSSQSCIIIPSISKALFITGHVLNSLFSTATVTADCSYLHHSGRATIHTRIDSGFLSFRGQMTVMHTSRDSCKWWALKEKYRLRVSDDVEMRVQRWHSTDIYSLR